MQRAPLSLRGLMRASVRVVALIVLLGISYLALARAGIAPDPFAPVTRGDVALVESDRRGVRVLFVGNSFTFYNSLPHLVHEIAASDEGAPSIFAVERTRGGWTFQEASEDDGLNQLLDEFHWDVVVLQEQSQMLSFSPTQWHEESYPYADRLRRMIVTSGAKPLLFMTWGYDRGDRHNVPNDSFGAMQARLVSGYTELGDLLDASVAPVGVAWSEAVRERPDIDLWDDDGRHPSEAGSYLAACVLYATITGRDPTESDFLGGLDPGEARFLQQVALS